MKINAFFIFAILAVLVMPVSAVSAGDINTDELEIPEFEAVDYSENPIGTLGALAAYVEHLVAAAEELLNFIDSIFEMLGMENDEDVKKLMDTLDSGMDITGE